VAPVRICVIDRSAAVRETVAIVLGAEYAVTGLSPDDWAHNPDDADGADLLIVGAAEVPATTVTRLTRGRVVLWLDDGSRHGRSTARRSSTIPHAFNPDALQRSVDGLLSARPPVPTAATPAAESILAYPYVPTDAALLADRAAVTGLPVLISGEPGTGKARVARAIHDSTGLGRFLTLSATSCTREALQQAGAIEAGSLTLYVDDLSALSADGQQVLLEIVDRGGFTSPHGWHPVRVICGTREPAARLAQAENFDKDLYYRLAVLPIVLPPLRERPEDIAPLAEWITSDLSHALSAPAVSLTTRAIERLSRYLWFGNLAELEAVLTRTVALSDARPIDADDLLFGFGRTTPRPANAAAAAAAGPVATAARTDSPRTVDLVINELAHEFKNPLVTIKTLAQHLEHLLADQSGHADVARLAGEAVDQMDQVLENLLQFTRFHAPSPDTVGLKSLLTPSLTALAPQLSERHVTLDYHPATSHDVFVDAEQVAYALDNLLHVVVREVGAGDTLCIRAAQADAALTVEYPGRGQSLISRLADLLDATAGDDGAALPLGAVLAKSLIERNGGRLDVDATPDRTRLMVWLPGRPPVSKRNGRGNGKATHPGS
jgi:DNA-binding NtrC family response regulator